MGTKVKAQRFPPPPPSLGPLGMAPFETFPFPCDFWDLANSAFLAFFSSFVFLFLSLISLHHIVDSDTYI